MRERCPLYPQKRTCAVQLGMSALCVPIADIAALFDHLVGGQKNAIWDGDAKRLGGFEIDNQFEFGGLLYWQFGRFSALQNSRHVIRSSTPQ